MSGILALVLILSIVGTLLTTYLFVRTDRKVWLVGLSASFVVLVINSCMTIHSVEDFVGVTSLFALLMIFVGCILLDDIAGKTPPKA